MICPIVLFVIGFALFFVFVFVREGSSLISCAILDSVDNNDGLLSSLSCQSPLSFYVKQTSFQDSPQPIRVSPGFYESIYAFPHADIILLVVIKGLIHECLSCATPHFLRTYCFVQRESTGPGHFLRPTAING